MSDAQKEKFRRGRHQMRNCLGVIRGFSELLLEETEKQSNNEAHLRFVVSTIDQARVLVDKSIRPDDVSRTEETIHIFFTQMDLDVASIKKTIQALIDSRSGSEWESFHNDLDRMRRASDELREAAHQLL